MMVPVFRKYYYLDESFVNDVYSTIFGYDYTEQEMISVSEKQTEGNLGFEKVVKAGIGGTKASEDTVRFSATKPVTAKLQDILDYLKSETGEDLPYYDQINDGIFENLTKDVIFEGVFDLSFTKIECYSEFVKMTKALDDILETDELKDKKVVDGMLALINLAEQERQKGLSCILKFASSSKYPCYCKLDQAFIKGLKSLLQGEVTVIGKVSRILQKGQTVNLTDITELSKIKILDDKTRQGKAQKVQQIKSGKKAFSVKDFQDEIKGPAIEIVPIAIYK